MTFFHQIFIPFRHFNGQILFTIGDALAGQSGLQAESRGFIELIVFVISGFIAGSQALFDDDMAG
jgi:hypothetical protein